MWNPILIHLASHPFLYSILPPLLGLTFLFCSKTIQAKRTCLLFIFSGCIIALILHLRWDSFSIHLSGVYLPEELPKKILFIGDSITHEGNRPRGYITKLSAYADLDYEVLAKPGATTQEIMAIVDSYDAQIIPEMIIVQAGINDLMEGISPTVTSSNLDHLARKLNQKYVLSSILFLPIHPLDPNRKLKESQITSSGNHLSPWWSDESEFSKSFLVKDGIHLNARGNTKLASAILERFSSNAKN